MGGKNSQFFCINQAFGRLAGVGNPQNRGSGILEMLAKKQLKEIFAKITAAHNRNIGFEELV
jgi:hypothetical protein